MLQQITIKKYNKILITYHLGESETEIHLGEPWTGDARTHLPTVGEFEPFQSRAHLGEFLFGFTSMACNK